MSGLDTTGTTSTDQLITLHNNDHTVGNGSPEGVLVGIVGDEYTDIVGGAGTTKYIKESGIGNTGWSSIS
jgi:hypothetical protein